MKNIFWVGSCFSVFLAITSHAALFTRIEKGDPRISSEFAALGHMTEVNGLIWSGVPNRKFRYDEVEGFCEKLGSNSRVPTEEEYIELAQSMGKDQPQEYNSAWIPQMGKSKTWWRSPKKFWLSSFKSEIFVPGSKFRGDTGEVLKSNGEYAYLRCVARPSEMIRRSGMMSEIEGLTWMPGTQEKVTHDEAVQMCAEVNARLPSVNEVKKLVGAMTLSEGSHFGRGRYFSDLMNGMRMQRLWTSEGPSLDMFFVFAGGVGFILPWGEEAADLNHFRCVRDK